MVLQPVQQQPSPILSTASNQSNASTPFISRHEPDVSCRIYSISSFHSLQTHTAYENTHIHTTHTYIHIHTHLQESFSWAHLHGRIVRQSHHGSSAMAGQADPRACTLYNAHVSASYMLHVCCRYPCSTTVQWSSCSICA